MFKSIIFFSSLVLSSLAFAGPDCTDEDQTKWKNKERFQKDLKKQGYKIKVFKVTSGNCYEIYGWDKDSKKVEIYYHPVTAKEIKRRTF